jgi:hypothetical protein
MSDDEDVICLTENGDQRERKINNEMTEEEEGDDLESVEFILSKHVHLDFSAPSMELNRVIFVEKTQTHTSVLLEACSLGNALIVKRLLQAEANACVTTHYGKTAWMCAAQSGSVRIMKMLCKSNKYGIYSRQYDGFDALDYACGNGHLPMIKYLVEKKHFLVEPHGCVSPPICLAASSPFPGHELVEYLHSKGGNLKAVDAEKNGLLVLAAFADNEGLVRWLLGRSEIDVFATNKEGFYAYNFLTNNKGQEISKGIQELLRLAKEGAEIKEAESKEELSSPSKRQKVD